MLFKDTKYDIQSAFLRIIGIGLMILLLFSAPATYGASTGSQSQEFSRNLEQSDIRDSVFGMSLDQLMNVEVAVTSLFPEADLVAGSSVSAISSEKWKKLGARRLHEVLNNEPGVMTYPHYSQYSFVIRGYTTSYEYRGISMLLDGIPLNDLNDGTALFNLPNWEIGTLDKVELIKGPGSAIYGSDAFHGVFSMRSFESDQDACIIEGAGGYPFYGDTNIKMSRGFDENHVRIDATASISAQDDLDLAYDYDDNGVTGTGTRKHEYDSKAGILKIRSTPNEKLTIKAGGYVSSWSGNDFPGLGSKYSGIRDKDLLSAETRFLMGTGAVSYMWDNGISVETGGYYWVSRDDPDLFIDQNRVIRIHLKNSRSGVNLILRQADTPLNIQWFLGYLHDRREIDAASRSIRTGDGQFLADLGEQPQSGWSREVNSLFGQLKWRMAEDKVYLLFGGRVDDYIDYTTQFTPRCGLIFLPTENASLKALYGRAFMTPDALNYFGSGELIEGNPDLRPEIIDVYELIYMYRTINWRFSLNGFYSLWEDGIINYYDPAIDATRQVNEGKNTSIGGEMNLFYTKNPFTLELGLSYVRSKAINSINPAKQKKEDRIYAAFPEYSISVGICYHLKPVNIDFYVNNRVYLHMEASPSNIDPDPDSLPEYYRMDCNVSKKFTDKWEAILDIRDVLNRKNHIPAITPNVNGYEEPGRSILLRMTYAFL